jgi:hypothetical protein
MDIKIWQVRRDFLGPILTLISKIEPNTKHVNDHHSNYMIMRGTENYEKKIGVKEDNEPLWLKYLRMSEPNCNTAAISISPRDTKEDDLYFEIPRTADMINNFFLVLKYIPTHSDKKRYSCRYA